MRVSILTLFPDMINNFFCESIIKRACDKGIVSVNAVNIRDFSNDKHNRVDDYPFGGDLGMLFKHKPVIDAFESLCDGDKKPYCIIMSPQGVPFNQKIAEKLSKKDDIAIICGHYEGIDERVYENICDLELSMGDFVLTGGEICAVAVTDATLRLVPGVLKEDASSKNESHNGSLLEYPQYTRPAKSEYGDVPEVLLSGHHKNIEAYRRKMAVMSTLAKREDMFLQAKLDKDDIEYLTHINKLIENVLKREEKL